MRRTGLLWVAMAAVIGISGCSQPDATKTDASEPQPAAVGTGGASSDVNSYREFVHDVAAMNLAEIELSRIALDKATRADIRMFARMMVEEHEAALRNLRTLVSGSSGDSGESIDWPAQLDERSRDTADELAKEQGSDFDREYVEAIVAGHQDIAALLESRLDVQSLADWKTAAAGRTQSKALPNPEVAMHDVQIRPVKSDDEAAMKVNQWAAETYPIAQRHLDTARRLEIAAKKGSTN